MSTPASNFKAKDLVLIEASASRQHEPGDEQHLKDALVNVAISVEFGVSDVSVHESGSEGMVTARFAVSEKISVDGLADDTLTRENKITCVYRILLIQDSEDTIDFNSTTVVADEMLDRALEYSHSYFRQKLRALSSDVFLHEFSLAPTWQETREQLDSGSTSE